MASVETNNRTTETHHYTGEKLEERIYRPSKATNEGTETKEKTPMGNGADIVKSSYFKYLDS